MGHGFEKKMGRARVFLKTENWKLNTAVGAEVAVAASVPSGLG